MPANRDDQRRHRHSNEGRRGHRLQHRDTDEGWAERGTWANLHDRPRASGESRAGDPDRGRRRTDDVGHARRSGPDARHGQSTRRSETAQEFGSNRKGNASRRDTSGRIGSDARDTSRYKSQGSPRMGSQRETKSDSVGTDAGGQFGDRHGPRPSPSEVAGYHEDEQFAGRKGRSMRDRRFGSRRGHGTQRREDPRTD